MERDVSAQTMREEEACDDAFLDDVESSSIVQAKPLRAGVAKTRIEDEFSQVQSQFTSLSVLIRLVRTVVRFFVNTLLYIYKVHGFSGKNLVLVQRVIHQSFGIL